MKNKKGFTMIELLLVIMLIGLLSIASYSAYNGSVATFRFLSNYKSAMSLVRNARSYAIVNKDSKTVDRYGVRIQARDTNNPGKVILFEDTLNPYEYDSGTDKIVDEFDFVAPFVLSNVSKSDAMPVTLFYNMGSGDLTAKYGDAVPPLVFSKKDYPYLTFNFTDGKISRYIVVFQVSGLAEEFTQTP